MDRKLIYIFSLFCVFLVWGVMAFTAMAPASGPVFQSTLPPAETAPVATGAGQVPVTGEREPLWTEILLFYGLIALTALFLILVLLNTVNKSMIAQGQRKESPSQEVRKH